MSASLLRRLVCAWTGSSTQSDVLGDLLSEVCLNPSDVSRASSCLKAQKEF